VVARAIDQHGGGKVDLPFTEIRASETIHHLVRVAVREEEQQVAALETLERRPSLRAPDRGRVARENELLRKVETQQLHRGRCGIGWQPRAAPASEHRAAV